jgi:hypothetical protein
VARETITKLIDDIDGGTAHETVRFALDGIDYEIDLSSKNSKKLRGELAGYIEKGTKVKLNGGPGRSAGKSRGRPDRDQNQAIREWALAKGLEVAARGRISGEIIDRYHAEAGKGTKAASQTAVKTVSAKVPRQTRVTAKKAAAAGLTLVDDARERQRVLREVKKFAAEVGMPTPGDLSVNEMTTALSVAVANRDDIALKSALDEISGKRPAFSG